MSLHITNIILNKIKTLFTDIEKIRYLEPILFWGVDYIQEVQNVKKNNNWRKIVLSIKELLIIRLNLKLDIPPIDFTLTNKCTLRCKECGAMMPYIPPEKYWTISYEQFKLDLDNFLKCVGNCYHLKFIGGEPLLVKDIDKMLEYACRKKQVKLINITTNGTIIPSEKLLKTMSKYRKKIAYTISDYSSNTNIKTLKHKQIIHELQKHKIKYFLSNHPWHERGDIYKHFRCDEENKRVYLNCWQMVCTALFNGEIHPCTRSAIIKTLTNKQYENDECINIRSNDIKNINKSLHKFYTKEVFSVCDYCDETKPETINTAEQTMEILKIGNKNHI